MMSEGVLNEYIRNLSNPDERLRSKAAWDLGEAARKGDDITPAIPALTVALSDSNMDVRVYAARALECAAANEKSRDVTLNALVAALSDGNTRRRAAKALISIVERGTDITPALPALAVALSDKDMRIRSYAAVVLANAARKGVQIDLEKVAESLKRCVAKIRETHDEALIRKTKQEWAGFYVSIANAVGKSRQKIDMGGELLTERPKPPKGKDEMYRVGAAKGTARACG